MTAKNIHKSDLDLKIGSGCEMNQRQNIPVKVFFNHESHWTEMVGV